MKKRIRTGREWNAAVRDKRLEDVAFLLSKGCTRAEIAKKFSTSLVVADRDIQEVIQGWVDQTYKEHEHLVLAEERLLGVARQCIADYAGNRKSEDTTWELCKPCVGTGIDVSTNRKCDQCKGEGEVQITRKRRRTKGGDPKLLQVAMGCFKEVAVLRGLHLQRKDLREDQASQHIHGHLHVDNNPFEGIPQVELLKAEDIIKQMIAVDRKKKERAIIEGTVVKEEEEKL